MNDNKNEKMTYLKPIIISLTAIFLLISSSLAYRYFSVEENTIGVDQELKEGRESIYYESFSTTTHYILPTDFDVYATTDARTFSEWTDTMTVSKIWEKSPNIRIDSILTSIREPKHRKDPEIIRREIVKDNIGYGYNQQVLGEEKYTKVDFTNSSYKEIKPKLLQEITKEIFDKKVNLLGSELIDEKEVTVVESLVYGEGMKGGNSYYTKAWIWTEKSIPLRIERIQKINGETIIRKEIYEYKNFKFEEISDKIFEVVGKEVIPYESGIVSDKNQTLLPIKNVREVNVRILKNQWKWSPEVIEAKIGDTIRLKIFNEDIIDHGFALDAFEINKRISPNRETVIEFVASKVGAFSFYCSIPCGQGHYAMSGGFIITE